MRRALLWLSAAGLLACLQWGCEEGGSGPTASRSDAGGSSGGGTAPLAPLKPLSGDRPTSGEQPPTGSPSENGQGIVPGSPEATRGPGGTVEEGYGAPYGPDVETPGYPGPARGPGGPPNQGIVTEGYGPNQGPPGSTSPPPAARVAFQPRSPEEAKSAENLKRIVQALLAYERQHGTFPPAATHPEGSQSRGLSWRVQLLPYLGLEDLYRRFNQGESWDSEQNRAAILQMPEVYRTPGVAVEGNTSYLAPIGNGAVLNEFGGQGRAAITDGTSNTIIVVEADAEKAVPWTMPQDLNLIPALPTSGLGSLRSDGFIAAMADGSIRRIGTQMDPNSIFALFTANGGERVDLTPMSSQPGAELPVPVSKQRLLDRARDSLAAGYANDAHQLLLAAAAGGDTEVLGRVQWSEELGRAALALRWGVGIVTEEESGNRGGEPGPGVPHGPGMMPGYGQGGGWAQAVRSTAGSLGDDVVEQLESVKSNEELDGWLVTAPAAEGDPRGGAPARLGEPALVGSGDEEALTQKALEEGLDVLVTLTTSTPSTRSGTTSGSGKTKLVIRILDVTKGTAGFKLWALRPLEIASGSSPYGGEAETGRPARKTRDDGDRSNRYLEGMTRQLERVLALEDMPEHTATQLHNRIVALTNQKQDNPLPALMELRYYAWKGLLPEDKFAEACTAVLNGDDGAKLAAGSPEERLAAIERWIPEPKAAKPTGPPGYGPPGMEGQPVPPGMQEEPVPPGVARRRALIGKQMELEGITLDGNKFDWSSYRGKVVLVDFWASWCPPCRAEMPNVKRCYEMYHDKGFDIVGISLDRSRGELEKYLKENEIPWTILYNENRGADGPADPASYYGVTSIPTVMLVDRDGTVVTFEARGHQLVQNLERLLGPADGPGRPGAGPPREGIPGGVVPVEEPPVSRPPPRLDSRGFPDS